MRRPVLVLMLIALISACTPGDTSHRQRGDRAGAPGGGLAQRYAGRGYRTGDDPSEYDRPVRLLG